MELNSIATLRNVDRDTLQSVFDNSTSVSEVLEFFGFIPQRKDSRKLINQLIMSLNIDMTKMHINLENKVKSANIIAHSTNTFVFDKGRFVAGKDLMRNLQKKGIPLKCAECSISDSYNGKPLKLQVHHIDGDNTNNMLENLMFLCPNCHSQTKSFTGRKNKRPDNVCKCGAIIRRESKMCRKCSHESELINGRPRRKFEVSKEELESLIKEKPMTEIGKQFGVSDSAIKKRCKKLGIELKDMRGYWAKLKAGKI